MGPCAEKVVESPELRFVLWDFVLESTDFRPWWRTVGPCAGKVIESSELSLFCGSLEDRNVRDACGGGLACEVSEGSLKTLKTVWGPLVFY